MSAGNGMNFLQERQARGLYGFLVMVCVWQTFFLGICGVWHGDQIRHVLTQRELAASSYLLEQDVLPTVIAAAWNHTEVTEAGRGLLAQIGHTEQGQGFLLQLMGQTSGPFLMTLLTGGILSAAVLLLGAGFFLQKRELAYEEAERIVTGYAEERFTEHLPMGETGAVYRLYNKVEQLALSLQAKSETERRAREFLRDMISDISHQLKTPLASLRMSYELVTGEHISEGERREFLAQGEKEIQKLEELLEELVNLSRLETHMIAIKPVDASLKETIAEAVSQVYMKARNKEIAVCVEFEGDLTVSHDVRWTAEAFANVLENAVKYSGAHTTVTVRVIPLAKNVLIAVEDEGMGIAKEETAKIYQRFYRGTRAKELVKDGAGVGLYLTRMILERQGGTILAKRRAERGTVFQMTLPR